jgi:hypothetical protein
MTSIHPRLALLEAMRKNHSKRYGWSLEKAWIALSEQMGQSLSLWRCNQCNEYTHTHTHTHTHTTWHTLPSSEIVIKSFDGLRSVDFITRYQIILILWNLQWFFLSCSWAHLLEKSFPVHSGCILPSPLLLMLFSPPPLCPFFLLWR